MIKDFIREKIRTSLILENRIKYNIPIPKDIIDIKDVFIKNGYSLFLVGGSVRDSLLHKPIKDYDLVTNALPDKIIEILRPQSFVKNILETGKAFGVINVITNNDEYEIASFRSDTNLKYDVINFIKFIENKVSNNELMNFKNKNMK